MVLEVDIDIENVDELRKLIDSFFRKEKEYLSEINLLKEQICCLQECIGQELSQQLDIVPAKIQVIRNIRPKYDCKNCEGVESDGPTVAIARMPELIIPKCIGTPGLPCVTGLIKLQKALKFFFWGLKKRALPEI